MAVQEAYMRDAAEIKMSEQREKSRAVNSIVEFLELEHGSLH
jgi:hypothetical protein